MMGHGVDSRSSHSDAAGRMTFSAKPCTQSRTSFWSCVSSSVKTGSAGVSATAASGAVLASM